MIFIYEANPLVARLDMNIHLANALDAAVSVWRFVCFVLRRCPGKAGGPMRSANCAQISASGVLPSVQNTATIIA